MKKKKLIPANFVPPRPPTLRTGKPGNPGFLITPAMRDRMEELAGRGFTQEQIAFMMGMAPITLVHKKMVDEDLKLALRRGKLRTIDRVAGGLVTNALTPTNHEPGGNVNAQKFYLATQGGWSQNQNFEGQGRTRRVIFEETDFGAAQDSDD